MPPVGTTINTLRWEGRPVALARQPIFIDYFTLRVHTNTPLELGSGCRCGQGSVNSGKLYCFVCIEIGTKLYEWLFQRNL